HLERHDARHLAGRRSGQPRSGRDGALCGAPDGKALTLAGTAIRLLLTRQVETDMARARRKAQRKETGVKGARILVVEARYYDDIADMLLRGAKRVLKAAQARYDIVTVPGALEVPGAIVMALDGAAAREEPYDGAVALGCVIRGETSH